jgi:superfamily II DNA or RNA helicase
LAIIASGTATERQRIQRLGRVLRPAKDKTDAVIFSLAATKPEIDRLKDEARDLSDFAAIRWSRA